MSHFDTALEAELLTQDFKNMLVKWGSHHSPRTGIHASDILVKDSEWCLRKLVLQNLSGEQAEQGEWNHWDWKRSAINENGWMVHRRIQHIHAKCGNVVWSPVSEEQAEDIKYHVPPALHKYYVKIDYGKNFEHEGQWYAAELDLTHYDEERNLFFSPDMITWFGGQKYIWEIKGINHDAFAGNMRFDVSGNRLELYDAHGKKIRLQEGITEQLEQACEANETVHHAREQISLYMHLTGIHRGIICVENKSNQDFLLLPMEYERERVMPYVERAYQIKGKTKIARSQGKLPLRCCQSPNESQARSCPMRNVCFRESEEW